MWTGNKPPPLPPSALQSGSNRQTTNSVTPKPRDSELEALRQRGLTTLLNRHFTEITQKVALERAAADAAMADLQARKAQTSEFVPSKDGELSPLDALYVKVNQWQKETRKKERETLLLYQRYVNKFGASGHVQVPATPTATATSGSGTAAMMVTPSTPSWAKHDADAAEDSPDNTPQAAAPPPPSTPTYVPTIAKKIEQALTEYLEAGGIELPSMELLGKDQTYQEVFAKHEAEFKNYYRRQLEERGIDARTSPRWSEKTPQEREDAVYKGPGAIITNNPLVRTTAVGKDNLEQKMPSTPEEPAEDNDHDDDDDVVDESDVFASSSPYFVNEDFDDRSLVSGLTTLNSAETRRVLQDCERSVATFLRDEHEAIKRMMLEEVGESDESDGGSYCNANDIGSITRAADQAEHLVKEMQQILDDFTTTDASQQMMMAMPENDGNDDDGEDADTTAAQKAGGRRYHTSNPDEYWVAYYDEAYQREYYHERNTNRTQWDPPDVDATSQSNSQSSPDDLMYEQVMPESSLRGVDGYERRGSRFEEYRRRRRRARKRRVMVAAAVAAVAVTMGISRVAYAKYNAWLATQPKAPINVELKESSPVVDLSMTPISLMDTLRILETERWQLFEEEQSRQQHRPWICNLPFAYVVHPRCRQLAKESPIFDLQALINAMLQ